MRNIKKNVLDFETILSRVKLFLKTDSDKEVALEIGMKPNAFYNRKAKGSVPLVEFVCLANTYNVSIDWLVNGTGSIYNDETPKDHLESNPLNTDLLEQIIIGVELGLKSEKLTMEPNKKAQLIIALYSTYAESKTKPSENKIIQFIKFAA